MLVGVCRVVLGLPGNNSLKGKRSVVKSVLERTRQKFHVAAAEVEDLDNHRRATLGFACVSNDARHARSMMDKVVAFVASSTEEPLIDREVRVERLKLGIGAGGDLDTFDSSEYDDEAECREEDGDDEER
jgi:uncharacterized protein